MEEAPALTQTKYKGTFTLPRPVDFHALAALEGVVVAAHRKVLSYKNQRVEHTVRADGNLVFVSASTTEDAVEAVRIMAPVYAQAYFDESAPKPKRQRRARPTPQQQLQQLLAEEDDDDEAAIQHVVAQLGVTQEP